VAATTLGIVYATGSKALRRFILPDNDSDLTNGTYPVAPGETLLVATDTGDRSIARLLSLIQAATGTIPADPRCAVVDAANKVVTVINADPALDSHPSGVLVSAYSPLIGIGNVWNPLTQLFSIPAITYPIGTPHTAVVGGVVTIGVLLTAPLTVPAQVIARPAPVV
jgi:hypothetical protein